MKKFLVIILVFVFSNLYSQKKDSCEYEYGYDYSKWDFVNLKSRRDQKQFGMMSGMMFLSGMGRGMEQVLVYHYDRFELRHPKANPNFWNPRYSWTNKYLHNNPIS